MKPVLYESTETSFSTNGIGVLSDAISCLVTEERNGAFELEMQYPISGIHYSEIALRSLIKAKADQIRDAQVFRVYKISKPLNGIVTINAEHLSYDLSGIPVSPFTADSAVNAMLGLKSHAVVSCPFTFYTDKETTAVMNVPQPCSIRSQLGGKQGSVLDVYGGEYEFDNYSVKLLASRGMNRGVVLRYGKNLTSLRQEQNCANVYTGVYPYWTSPDGTLVELTEKIINVSGTFDFTRIMMLDLSADFSDEPTQEQLRSRAESYIEANQIGVPNVNLEVEFAQLEQSEEYAGIALLERVQLCDTVRVHFPALGVDATAKAIRLTYNVLLDRVEKVELGNARTNLVNTIVAQGEQLAEGASQFIPVIQTMVDQLTETIVGAKGGAVRLLDTDGDGTPDTLYIADNEDPEQAVKVWRFNYQGWGASVNGYNGPFTLGASISEGLIADFITAGTLNSGLVTVGGTGTTLTGTSLTVMHPSLGANYKTIIDASGLRMMNGTTVLGGIVNLGGQYVAAVQQLYNPSAPYFRADVGEQSGVGEEMLGINFRFNNGVGGMVGAYSIDGQTVGGLGVYSATSNPIYIDAQNSDVVFLINHNGQATSVSLDYIYSWIRQHDD